MVILSFNVKYVLFSAIYVGLHSQNSQLGWCGEPLPKFLKNEGSKGCFY
jgi:hypothetical protein